MLSWRSSLQTAQTQLAVETATRQQIEHELAQARLDLAIERAQNQTLEKAQTQHHVMTGWLCARINQLEATNAVLLKQLTSLEIPTPKFTAQAPRGSTPDMNIDAVMGSALFEDMGDIEARRQGIKWDAQGQVSYAAVPAATDA